MSHYRHTQHARNTMAGEPYLLQPVPFARVNTALAIQGRTALSTHHMDSMTSNNDMSSAPQQPCGPGAVCRRSADCTDHYCEGHPANTWESSDPTDFAGIERPADEPSPLERTDHDPVTHKRRTRALSVLVGMAVTFELLVLAFVIWSNKG